MFNSNRNTFKTRRKHQKTISVTDLASYAADVTDFIIYKKEGLTSQQEHVGTSFHDSLHKSKSNKGVLYVILGVILLGFIIRFFIL
jgi:hypothetical protein